MENNPRVLDELLGKNIDGFSSTKKFSLEYKPDESVKKKSTTKLELEMVPVEILSEELNNSSQVYSGGNILKKKASVIEGSELTLVRPTVKMTTPV